MDALKAGCGLNMMYDLVVITVYTFYAEFGEVL